MNQKLLVISFFLVLFCLNLVQAQTPTLPQPPPVPEKIDLPKITGAAQGPAGGQGGSAGSGTASTVGVKYSEYESYCSEPLDFKSLLNEKEFKLAYDTFQKEYVLNKKFKNFELMFNFLLNEEKFQNAKILLTENKSFLTPLEAAILNARLLTSQKKYHQALVVLNDVSENEKKNVLLLLQYSQTYHKLKNLFEAKSALQDLMSIDKKNQKNYLLNLCVLETEDANHSEVEVICPRVIKAFPKDYLAYIYLGISSRDQLNYKLAQKYFNSSIKIQKNEFALTCLGEVHNLQKNYGKAIEAFKAATEVEPRSGRAQLGAAMSLYQLQRYDEALPYFINACKLDKKTSRFFSEALKPLEENKIKISTAYFNGLQECGSSH